MDPEAFSAASLYKWERAAAAAAAPQHHHRLQFEPMALPPSPPPPQPSLPSYCVTRPPRELLLTLEDFFQPYGIRYTMIAKIAELGFTVSTLLDMRDEELDEMMITLSQIVRLDLLVGEKYGIKAAIRAERRRYHVLLGGGAAGGHVDNTTNPLDALSQGGLSEEPVMKEAAGSGGGTWDMVSAGEKRKKKNKAQRSRKARNSGDENYDDEDDEEDAAGERGCGRHRQREHPFVVTEPGEVARGKKNGLDYLFHLYEECRQYLIQVQNIAKDRGEKCPTKVTNQVYRHAIQAGATHINKPKIRHYVHCYALHCLDEEASNALRKAFKDRGENVGAWRQACYEPLVKFASDHHYDIDCIFNDHPRLSIWYVPTKLRKLCHAQRNNVASTSNSASF
ncbi:hypothetical protein AQUCO_04300044v1 [Aquilegia coerulea]|uniref:Floricaula/leafy-like transcription factor n=1 Tax=Aquilegia coerulea TaxID=218851 RepID=A0A2G5CNG6_AQUCA|nr:hypothetical protein AQUCO_04300044v1 [Aquilegia coerulea]